MYYAIEPNELCYSAECIIFRFMIDLRRCRLSLHSLLAFSKGNFLVADCRRIGYRAGMKIEYRRAVVSDMDAVCAFCDFWMGGYGVAEGIHGAGSDYFVPRGRHEAYLKKYIIQIALVEGGIVGWAVLAKKGVLIHLLVSPTFRRAGIGKKLVKILNPTVVRSKTDQKAGNPAKFYHKLGYKPRGRKLTGRNKNIQMLYRADAD